jgi:hypothetical protein
MVMATATAKDPNKKGEQHDHMILPVDKFEGYLIRFSLVYLRLYQTKEPNYGIHV